MEIGRRGITDKEGSEEGKWDEKGGQEDEAGSDCSSEKDVHDCMQDNIDIDDSQPTSQMTFNIIANKEDEPAQN